ncbi:MAG: sigma 54-interacting transcriptional regulator [Desulfobacterales bacterium]
MAQLEIKPHTARHEPLPFERLLVEISTFFINLPADRIDSEIDAAQHRICEALDIDRSTLWITAEDDPGTLMLAHIHQPPGFPSPPERMKAADFWPWTTQKVMAGETLAISKMTEFPAEAGRDRESYRLYGTKSTVLVPLSVGRGNVFGALTFAVTREERDWPKTVVLQFQMVAQVFANALARKRMDHALCQSETRLSMATNAAGAGLWMIELDTRRVWVTPKTRELFHFAPDAELNDGSFYERIHPEERERVKQAVQQAIRSGERLRIEFRIVSSDGNVRWIDSLGGSFSTAPGLPERLMGVSIDITVRKEMEGRLREQLKEIERLKLQLEQENIYLREEITLQHGHDEIVGRSAAMKQVLAQVEQVAGTEASVLLQGETGTGKELLARTIHGLSGRRERPLITINCAALPPTLIESELFGREKGAYTGAMTRMAGRFEIADRSTLFLDEIGELSLDLQAKLLRVLEEGRFERLGSTKPFQVNVRVIAATNRNLVEEVSAGRFRRDVYYRLNVFPILIPPLRERREDIPSLVWAFVKQLEKKMGKRIDHIPRKDMEAMQRYPWPGNARQLRNIVEHAMITGTGETLRLCPPQSESEGIPTHGTLEDVERRHILGILEKTGWRLTGKGGAADILGLKRTTLYSKMKKLGIKRPANDEIKTF